METDEDKPSKGKFWKHLLKQKDLSGQDVRLSFQWHCLWNTGRDETNSP